MSNVNELESIFYIFIIVLAGYALKSSKAFRFTKRYRIEILGNVFYCKFFGPIFLVGFTPKQTIFNYYSNIKVSTRRAFPRYSITLDLDIKPGRLAFLAATPNGFA
jgi:hypothetical protein